MIAEVILSGFMLLICWGIIEIIYLVNGSALLWRHWRYNAITIAVCCIVFAILRYVAYSLIDPDLTGAANRSMNKAEFIIISLLMLGVFKVLHAREISDHVDYSVVGVIILGGFMLPDLIIATIS